MAGSILKNRRLITLLSPLIVAAILYLGKGCSDSPTSISNNPSNSQKPESNTQAPAQNNPKSQQTLPNSDSDASILALMGKQKMYYTRHAKCRMDCRFISESEIKEIMSSGKINHRKSDPQDAPCPTYALEGITSEKQEVRIVLAACDNETKVITVIDLGTDHHCDCK